MPPPQPLPDLWRTGPVSERREGWWAGRGPMSWDLAHFSAVSRVLGATLPLNFHSRKGSRYSTPSMPLFSSNITWALPSLQAAQKLVRDVLCELSAKPLIPWLAASEKLGLSLNLTNLTRPQSGLAQAIHQETRHGILLLSL